MEALCAAALATAAQQLRARARRSLSDAAVGARLAEGLRLLHGQLTRDRARRAKGYLSDPRLQLAYLAHHFPMHATKVAVLVSEAMEAWTPPPGPLRLLDVGAGPLSATAGAMVALGRPAQTLAVDHVGAMMQLGAQAVRHLSPHTNVTLKVADVSVVPALMAQHQPHLTVVANVLGELGPATRAAWLHQVVAALPPQGHLLLLEPGTRLHAWALAQDRAALLARGKVHVWAPCIGHPTCPMASGTDWCHADRPVAWPEAYTQLAARAGIDARHLKFSHLWLSPQPPPPAGNAPTLRLVGGPMQAAGDRLLRYACGPRGRVTLQANVPAAQQALAAPARGALWPPHPGVQAVSEPLPSRKPAKTPGRHPTATPKGGRGRGRVAGPSWRG